MKGKHMIKNYQIFKETVNNVIQNSNLDIGAVYFILKDIFSEIERVYYSQINKECLEEAEKIESDSNLTMENRSLEKSGNSYTNQNKKE